MSTASASCTLTRMRNGVSYTAIIVSSLGDLYQYYDSSRVVPDFSAGASEQPVLTFICGATASTDDVPPTIKVYWDGVEVTFANLNVGTTNNAVTGLAAGTIKIEQKGDPATKKPWKLRFVKNIATATATTQPGHSLKIVGIFAAGRTEAVKAFDLTPLTESGEAVHIISGSADATPFVVDQNKANSKCTLVAQVYRAGKAVTTTAGYGFQWYKKDVTEASGWKLLAGKTGQSLEVTASDVETYAEYKVEVTHGGTSFADTQSVMDVGDPYYVTLSITDQNNASADGSMNGDIAANEARKYTAGLVSRSGGSVPPIKTCNWLISTVDGVIQNGFTSNTNSYGVASRTYNTTALTIPATFVDSLNGGAGVQNLEITVTITF